MDSNALLARLLYRDAMVLIIDKPAGIPVHKGRGGGETLEDYFEALRFGLPRRPALAHRLDRDTSGCLVLGRHRQALNQLGKLFAGNQVKKTYWAIVQGTPPKEEGVINAPLAKQSEQSHRWHMQVSASGQPALTSYRVLGQANGCCWLELKPHTGRTHQLRVHCAYMGCPIVGDRIYGIKDAGDARLQLHARAIAIPLHAKKPPIEAVAPAPEAMLKLLIKFQCDDKVLQATR